MIIKKPIYKTELTDAKDIDNRQEKIKSII
jgi:hypothetical protein